MKILISFFFFTFLVSCGDQNQSNETFSSDQGLSQEHKKEFKKDLIEVTEDIYVGVGYGLANSIMIETENSLVIVDTLGSVERAEELYQDFREISEKPITAIVYTHNHLDHLGGSTVFYNENKTEIYAQENIIYNLDNIATTIRPIIFQRSARQFGIPLPEEEIVHQGIGGFLEINDQETLGLVRPTILFDDSLIIEIDNLKLDGNSITTINSVQELILDPDPTTDAGGLVIIKGDLQIDGTTTTVNSASMSVNDPTIELGDPTTPVTLTAEAAGGQANVVVDAIDQLQVGDAVTSTTAGIPNSTVINAINTGNKQVTLSNNLSQTMAVGSVLVTVSGADDQLDRGVKVHYNASGTNQFGFFGYDRTGGADGAGAWTFIENATDTNTVFGVTGDRGTVVLGDLELDTDLEVQYGGTGVGTFTSKGILYGNGTGALQVTAEANMASPGTGTDVSTSFQILTVTATGVPVWTDTIDGGTF